MVAARSLLLGTGNAYDSGGASYPLGVNYSSTTAVALRQFQADQTYTFGADTTQAVPFTFGASDTVEFQFEVPITGWSSTTLMSNDTDTRVVEFRGQNTAGTTLGAAQDIPFTATTDSHGAWSTATFTTPVSGYYQIQARLSCASSDQGTIYLYKNGSEIARYGAIAITGLNSYQINDLLSLVAGDTIKIRADSAGTPSLQTTAGINVLTIARVSGPATIAATDTVAALYTGTATGTLNGSFNIATIPTKQNDTHNAYSSGTYTIPVSGSYNISAQVDVQATFSAGQSIQISIYNNGSAVVTNAWFAGSATNNEGMPAVAATGIRLIAGDLITIRTATAGTTPAYAGTVQNYFGISKVGN